MKDDENARFGDIDTRIKAYSATEKGRNCFQSAKFLDELIQLILVDNAEFNKRMKDFQQDKDGGILTFSDGTFIRASALIACDGIKSLCWKVAQGQDSLEAEPVSAGEYAYRTLLDRSLTNEILTPELAGNGSIYCGKGSYIISYTVDKWKLVNVVAIKRKVDNAWDKKEWLAQCRRETMLKDFEERGDPLRKTDLQDHGHEAVDTFRRSRCK